MKIKVLSWNIWGGRNIEGVAKFLKIADADIIALQEVIRENHGDTAQTLAEQLSEYEHSPISSVAALDMKISSNWTGPIREKEETLMFGTAILTKYKIIRSETHDISPGEKRVVLSVDIAIGGSITHVWSVHLKHLHMTSNKPEIVALHRSQADTLLSLLPKTKAIVMGDFNNTPESDTIKKMKSVLRDAEEGVPSPTWISLPGSCTVCPQDGSAYKLDYIFASNDLEPLNFEVGDSRASDHVPILATIEL